MVARLDMCWMISSLLFDLYTVLFINNPVILNLCTCQNIPSLAFCSAATTESSFSGRLCLSWPPDLQNHPHSADFLQQSLSICLQQCTSYLSLSLCHHFVCWWSSPSLSLIPSGPCADAGEMFDKQQVLFVHSCCPVHADLHFPCHCHTKQVCSLSHSLSSSHTGPFQALKDMLWSILGIVPCSPLIPGSMAMMDEGYIGAAGPTLVSEQWARYRLDIICACSCQWKMHPITAAKLGSVCLLLRGWQTKETGVIDWLEKTVRYVWLLHCLLTETRIRSCNEGALNHDLYILWTLLSGFEACSTMWILEKNLTGS